MKIFYGILLCISFALGFFHSQTPTAKHEAMTLRLDCASGDCPLLKGMPQTAGLRSGYVRLEPGRLNMFMSLRPLRRNSTGIELILPT